MKHRTTSLSLPGEILDHLDALAARHGLSRSEVVARFVAAGLQSNAPVTAEELARLRALRSGQLPRAPGLVVPMPPLARRSSSPPPAAAEKSGGEDGNPRRLTVVVGRAA